nr:hypothetical protein [Tanacetum cinerariifolium]
MFVEDESCPIYDTDNEEEESMSVYDTDIEDVIDEEEGFVGKGGIGEEEDNIEDVVVVANDIFVGKGGIGEEEDNIEDVVVVANDICSLMIQTTLCVDVEEDINTKSHELMSFGKSIIIKGIQIWMLRVQGTSEANSRMIFSQAGEDDAKALTFSQSQNA